MLSIHMCIIIRHTSRSVIHFHSRTYYLVHSSSRGLTLTSQPPEVLDQIASFLPSPRDLLSLVRTCSRLHAVIAPRHLAYWYRVISCCIGARAVWVHLAAHPALARNVRRVEVLDERDACMARGMGTRARAASSSNIA